MRPKNRFGLKGKRYSLIGLFSIMITILSPLAFASQETDAIAASTVGDKADVSGAFSRITVIDAANPQTSQARSEKIALLAELTLSACGNLTTENAVYTMNQPIQSSGTCLNVMANNITIDCQGYKITYSQSAVGYAVNSSFYNSTTVKNCNIVAPTTAINYRHAIYYYRSSNGTIFNNTITTNPGSGSNGINLESSSNFNVILNNTITTNGDAGDGIYLDTGSSFNTFSGNTITINGESSIGGGHGLFLNGGSNSNILSNNTVTVTYSSNSQFIAGIHLSLSTNNTLKSNKVYTYSTNSYLLVGTNSSHYNNSIDTSNYAEGLPVYYFYNQNNLLFNNTNFAIYGQVIFGWCRNITITNSNFSSDSLSLFNTNTSTIFNNSINSNKGIGLWLHNSSRNNISNNIITTSNTYQDSYGLYLYSSSSYNNISNNTINPSSGTYSHGIYLHAGPIYNNISNNNITTSASDADGIYLYSASNNTIDSNTITTSGLAAYGMFIRGAYNNTINNNTITALGLEAYGIFFYTGSNNSLTNNKVNSLKTSSYAFLTASASDCSNSIGSSNLAEGLPVNYTYNADNLVSNGVDFTIYGQVIFCNGRNITITNSSFSRDSLNLFGINASTISNNRINTSTGNGIYLSGNSNNNTINNNTIITSGINGNGINLYSWGGDSLYNNITNNIITTSNSSAHGIYLNRYSYYNYIINNTLNTVGGGSGIFLEIYPSNNVINNNRVNASAGYGIYLGRSATSNKINNNTITTSNLAGIGIYSNSDNNVLNNNSVTTLGGGYGILISTGANNNTFSGMYVTTSGKSSAYGIYVGSYAYTSTSFTMTDSIINSSNASNPVWEFLVSGNVTGGTWNFTNVTRADNVPIKINWGTGVNGTLNMHWYMDVNVKNTTGPLENANVTSYNNRSALIFSEPTSAAGKIARKTLLQYTRNSTSGTVYTWYSPYNMSIVAAGYARYVNNSVNMSNNVFMDINMACICPVGEDWIARENCTLTNFVCNMSGYMITCSPTGSLTLAGNSIIRAKKVITPNTHGCIFIDGTSRLLIKY